MRSWIITLKKKKSLNFLVEAGATRGHKEATGGFMQGRDTSDGDFRKDQSASKIKDR